MTCNAAIVSTCLLLCFQQPVSTYADKSGIQGDWELVSFVASGVAYKERVGERMNITEATITGSDGMGGVLKLQYTIDPRQTPKHIDITIKIENKPVVVEGIYMS